MAGVPIVFKSGSLNLLEPSGPVQACNGIALPLQGESRTPCMKRENLVKNLSNCVRFPRRSKLLGTGSNSVNCDPWPLYYSTCLKTKDMTNSSDVRLAPLRNPTAPRCTTNPSSPTFCTIAAQYPRSGHSPV